MSYSLTTAGVAKINIFCLFNAAATTVSTEPYKYQYTVEFNTSMLSHKKHHPNYAELFLHVLTEGGHNPAEIKIDSNHIQQPITWQQPSQASGEDDGQTAETVQSVRISLTSLSNSSSWLNDSTLTITVTSTNPIRMPSGNHYQTAVGLVLYMGGAPEAIDQLLTTPIPSSADHTLSHHKQPLGIGATRKRKATGSTPCQLQGGFKVTFKEVKGGYEEIIRPKMIDIKKCVGECPHFLHHLHNPSQHAEVRNLMHFREGSAGADVTPASCVPTNFKPLPVVLYNEADKTFSSKTLDKLIATSCGCR